MTIAGSDLATLDFFVASFTITPVGDATPGAVAFADPQVGDFSTDPDYVFFGRSGLFSRGLVGGVLTIGDFATGPAGPSTGPLLLARLELSALAMAVLAEQYTVTLDINQSDFQDPNGPLTISGSSVLSGTVTIVPEPGGLTLAGQGLGLAGLWRVCPASRRRRPASS